MSALPLTLIAAVARNRVIGRGGGMPWHLPGDLSHFRAATMGKPVLVGRKTFASIGGPLPGRSLVVLTRDPSFCPGPNVASASSLETALDLCAELGSELGAPEIMVAGGGVVYAMLLARATTMLLTEVDLAPQGDTRFPEYDRQVWREIERTKALQIAGDVAPYRFVTYRRS